MNLTKDFDLLDAYDSIDTIEGGMSLVKVCHSKIDQEIIVVKIPKVTGLQDNAIRALWLFESRNWLNVGKHENIVGFRRMHFAGGMPHLIFDFVDNNLRKSIFNLKFKEIITISIGISEAIIHLQKKLPSFIHKDLKPENILLDKNKTPKLADLGVSYSSKNRDLFNNNNKYYYDTNLVFNSELNYGGTLQYMSPEQMMRGDITIQSDIYSFGLILYEMLTGTIYYYDKTKLNFDFVSNKLVISAKDFENIYLIIQNCIKQNAIERFKNFEEISEKLKLLYFQITKQNFTNPKVETNEDGQVFGFIDSLIKFGEFKDASYLISELKGKSERLFLKSKIQNRLENYKEAIEFALEGLKKLTTKNASFRFLLLEQLANGYSGDNQIQKAISIKLEIAELMPTNSVNYFKLGEDYYSIDDYDKAEKYLNISVSISSNLFAYDLLFTTLSKLEKYSEILLKLEEIEPYYQQNPMYYRMKAQKLFLIASKYGCVTNLVDSSKSVKFVDGKLQHLRIIIGCVTNLVDYRLNS